MTYHGEEMDSIFHFVADEFNTDGIAGMHRTMQETNGFCSGESGMVMIMEGFQWALKGESSCINLYFASWTLNTRGKFVIGMLGVVLLGICAEGVSRLRHELSNKARGAHADEHFKYTLLQTGLHGLHALTGYILMLATMTFSCEMMLSVIVGLMIGYYVFGQATVISSSPCCAFLEDECDVCEPLRDPTQPRNDTGLPLEVGSCRVEINTSTPDNVIVEESTTSEGMP